MADRLRIATAARALTLTAALFALAPVAPAQDVPQGLPFLVVDQERLLNESLAGQAVLAEEEADRKTLADSGSRIDAELEAEEQRLTGLRDETEPEAFRAMADAFDDRVVAARREQEEAARAASLRAESRRREFFSSAAPVLAGILADSGAAAIVDQRSILISNQNLNITAEAIRRLDAAFQADQQDQPGDEAPAEDAPADQP